MDISKKYHLSMKKVGSSHYDQIGSINAFLSHHPDFAQGHNDIAVLYYQIGDKLRSLAHLEKAVRLQPASVPFLSNLADFYFDELGWNNDAEAIYLDILRVNPCDIDALISLAQIKRETGREDDARSCLERVLELDPRNDRALQIIQHLSPQSTVGFKANLNASVVETPGLISSPRSQDGDDRSEEQYVYASQLAAQGKEDEAISELELLVKSNPGFAPAYNDLGVLYTNRGEMTAALRNYEQSVNLQPSSSIFRRNLADFCYIALDNKERALNLYVELLVETPQDTEVLLLIANICIALSLINDARHFLNTILELDPGNETARQTIETLNNSGHSIAAASADELHHQALELAASGQTSEAITVLESLVAQYGGDASVYNDMGVFSYALGDTLAAQNYYEKALATEPNNDIYRKNLADLYFVALGRTDDAIYMYLDILKGKPNDTETLSALACICMNLEHYDEAQIFLGKILELEPWNSDARGQLHKLDSSHQQVFF